MILNTSITMNPNRHQPSNKVKDLVAFLGFGEIQVTKFWNVATVFVRDARSVKDLHSCFELDVVKFQMLFDQ